MLTKTENLAVNEEGTVVEWLVKMRRLPESRKLTVLAAENRLTDAHFAEFVRKLSRFHELAPACRFDYLEFDVELKRLDVTAELAYFTMECRHAGFARVAKRCISEYRSRCPGSPGPGHLMDFYASLAATVRAGLMGWRALETPVGDEWRQWTVAYLKDAQHYIDKAA